jgi:AraC family transcriptional regulator of adaptative response / DNA-3-methyladenine glycosylase II
MAEVALASGFNSVRRFNETFRTCSGGRRRRCGGPRDRTGEAGALSVRLSYRPPYDWDAMLSFLAARAIPGVETSSATPIAAHRDRRQCGVISVAPADKNRSTSGPFSRYGGACRRSSRGCAGCSILPPIPTRSGRICARSRAGAAGAARPGLRVPGAWDGFELAVRAIFGQQITVPPRPNCSASWCRPWRSAAGAMRRDAKVSAICFPRHRIAAADLASLGMPGARAMAVTSLAQAIAADPAIFSRGASLEDAIAKLRALPGIGEWTAQYIAMRELREPDAFPPPTSACCARWPIRTAGVRQPPNCLRARALAAVARLCGVASVGRRRNRAGEDR